MTDDLVRFGVAMDRTLLGDLDGLVESRGGTRSEVLRDLVRAEVMRSRAGRNVPAVATLTLVYDHHVRELTERLTEFQHRLGERVRATLHIHLDENRCLEVIVLKGRSDELKDVGARLLATRGVTHGNLELVTEDETGHRRHAHVHEHAHRETRRR
jgi:CopG family nickel-responsive transcriptional regulator